MPDYVSVGVRDEQEMPPGEWVTVRWDHEYSDGGHHHRTAGGPSVVEGPARYTLNANVRIQDLPPGTELQARAIERADGDGAVEAGPVAEYLASNGDTFIHYALAADTVGSGRRVRFQVIHYGTGTARLVSGSAKALAWRL